jgi:tRNA threonylcarbamoyladenosine biosynthesis protein TsaE
MITRHIQITTHSPEETQDLGQKIGELLKAGIVLTLTGDLGSGKTCFVQGLARGLDVPSDYYITSPTYTLINEYPGRYPLFHVDLYRIEDPLDLEDIGLYEILHGNGVVAIEWAERLREDLPSEHVSIDFEILDHESRKIGITAYGLEGINMIKKLENLIEEKK